MKVILIVLISLVSLAGIAQVLISKSLQKTEVQAYEVLKDYGPFEIRKYQPTLYSYVVMESDSYKSNSSRGFRKLAGYIFGGNEQNQSIAMTSPVTMTMDDSVTMKFKIPEGMELNEMPKPSDPSVRFEQSSEKIVAAIRFGGWSSDDSIEKYKSKLRALLDENKIKHKESFSYLGYNPPFELINRRNEIIVDVDWEE